MGRSVEFPRGFSEKTENFANARHVSRIDILSPWKGENWPIRGGKIGEVADARQLTQPNPDGRDMQQIQ